MATREERRAWQRRLIPKVKPGHPAGLLVDPLRGFPLNPGDFTAHGLVGFALLLAGRLDGSQLARDRLEVGGGQVALGELLFAYFDQSIGFMYSV